jgi:ribonuclease HII
MFGPNPEKQDKRKYPDLSIESLFKEKVVCGVDEAGRGAWAGPVVAAAVVIPCGTQFSLTINDSKQLSALRREILYEEIIAHCHVGIGMATEEEIETINILQASMLAMRRAVALLALEVNVVLVDGNKVPDNPDSNQILWKPIIRGDQKSLSIAAASIVAKEWRDISMKKLANEYPLYQWQKNKGYGTKVHREAIECYGITKHHRRLYKPVRLWIKEHDKNNERIRKI